MKKMKYFRLFLSLAVITFTFNSCDDILDQSETDFGKGPVLAQFINPVAELNIIKTEANTPVDFNFEVSYFGGKNVLLEEDVTITIATSSLTEVQEGTGFELLTTSLTIPAGQTSTTGSLRVFTEPLIPFDFKDIVLEITSSSQSISELNTMTLTLKALGADSLAGVYEVIESDYYRINVQSGAADWTGSTRVIEAISETTYRRSDWFGPFETSDQGFFFIVDSNDKITMPKTSPIDDSELIQFDNPLINCSQDSGLFIDVVPCESSNFVERTNDRRDLITITYGYNAESGTRQFYEKLRRIE